MSNTVSFENEVLEACAATSRDGKPAFFSELTGAGAPERGGSTTLIQRVSPVADRTECT